MPYHLSSLARSKYLWCSMNSILWSTWTETFTICQFFFSLFTITKSAFLTWIGRSLGASKSSKIQQNLAFPIFLDGFYFVNILLYYMIWSQVFSQVQVGHGSYSFMSSSPFPSELICHIHPLFDTTCSWIGCKLFLKYIYVIFVMDNENFSRKKRRRQIASLLLTICVL